ncbi:hypothetical protein N7448_005665 [Penicillium atrosanguineum]|uniref:Uncharacterized protein n=1 Tax=Penicillium atrosanguineum TaxID=1132637 RepID=A0A9W9PN48_9EURO|nr:hypothetical protein N7526_008538 [Penicillium atrosanguineum]KAJ5137111.1 hypothetical protein N7448_005665 [Penicillium atrosanguineum]KAJ5302515.1 hypothetical protein N7476_009314 [Penicillium atrosanguineum]
MTWALTGDKEEAMRFSNWKSMLRQARQPSREMPEAMQVLSSSPMTEAQGHNPDAEGGIVPPSDMIIADSLTCY